MVPDLFLITGTSQLLASAIHCCLSVQRLSGKWIRAVLTQLARKRGLNHGSTRRLKQQNGIAGEHVQTFAISPLLRLPSLTAQLFSGAV